MLHPLEHPLEMHVQGPRVVVLFKLFMLRNFMHFLPFFFPYKYYSAFRNRRFGNGGCECKDIEKYLIYKGE